MYSAVRATPVALRNALKSLCTSAPVRVYVLRALLLSDLVVIIDLWIWDGLDLVDGELSDLIFSAPFCFSICHHILVLFRSRLNYAIIDFVMVLMEVGGMYSLFLLFTLFFGLLGPLPILIGINLVALLFSLCLRLAGFQRGRFNLFNRCARPQVGYSPLEIIFGRSVDRPLVRGESRVIGIIRLISLAGLCVIIPAFGFYVLVVSPMQAQPMTRNIKVPHPFLFPIPENNATILLLYVPDFTEQGESLGFTLSMLNVTVGNAATICTTSPGTDPGFSKATASCPWNWDETRRFSNSNGITVSANLTDTGGILYVKPGEGDPADVREYTEVIPLIPGSHLSVVLGTTQRQTFSKNALDLLGFTTPLRTILVKHTLLVQTDLSPPDSGAGTVSLRFRERNDVFDPTRIVQDYTDTSVLTGVATFGGFWTFVNGTFALFFGANMLYFLLRRRPLSALGLAHIFQRRNLTRKWHEDFPALHTEGGRPGSESAGIVAFLPGDLEAQASNVDLQAELDANGPGDKEWETLVHVRLGSSSARSGASEDDQTIGCPDTPNSKIS
ncbi:hypothetical protein C8R44DRAFT_804481 [Mycena epipterygia]|nr:hypothetical protein C8R44DRAFT_804481 [Mycena epipterygia]